MRKLSILLLLTLSACAFSKPGAGIVQTQTDYNSCHDQLSSGGNMSGAFGAIGAAVYAGSSQAQSERQQMDACMISKGYTPGALDF